MPGVRYYHWYLSIVPRLTRVAGFELGSGIYINTVLPEDAAAFLRQVSADGPADRLAVTRSCKQAAGAV
jgi:UDPglucose--hexose-1-phosphate uridylyltransferase